jgi:hypothetical protein
MSGVFKRGRGAKKTCPKTLSLADRGPSYMTDSPLGQDLGDIYYGVFGYVQ